MIRSWLMQKHAEEPEEDLSSAQGTGWAYFSQAVALSPHGCIKNSWQSVLLTGASGWGHQKHPLLALWGGFGGGCAIAAAGGTENLPYTIVRMPCLLTC